MNTVIWAFGITVAVMLAGWAIYTMASDTQAVGSLFRDVIERPRPGDSTADVGGAEVLWFLFAFVAFFAIVGFVAVNI